MASRVLGGPSFFRKSRTKVSYQCSVTLGARQKVSEYPSLCGFMVKVSLSSLSRCGTIHVLGTGDVVVVLGIFTDPQLSTVLENRPTPLGKPFYVVLRATGIDPDRFASVANEVLASSNISRTGAVKSTYRFVKER